MIHLGKFRLLYQEERKAAAHGDERYLLQQRAVVRLNEDLVRIERAQDYTVLCDEAHFRRRAGRRPSPLQYFIASIGFCMFSQLARFAAKLAVPIDDAEMELSMTYELQARRRFSDFATAAQSLDYLVKLESNAPLEQIVRVAQLTDRSCHTVNSLRKHVPVSGKLLLNGAQHAILD